MKLFLIIILPIFLLMACEEKDKDLELKRLNAETTYLKVSINEMEKTQGEYVFTRMRQGEFDSLYEYENQCLRKLELDSHDPQKHYDAKCQHSFGICQIKTDIETATGTISFMLAARKK